MELKLNTVGVVVDATSKDEHGNYHFFVGGKETIKDTNVLYVSSTKALSEEELREYIKGTNNIEEIIKLK